MHCLHSRCIVHYFFGRAVGWLVGVLDENRAISSFQLSWSWSWSLSLAKLQNFTHATFYCPFVSTIIGQIRSTFFPNISSDFPIRDIILATTTNTHPLYEGTNGQKLASIIWDTLPSSSFNFNFNLVESLRWLYSQLIQPAGRPPVRTSTGLPLDWS